MRGFKGILLILVLVGLLLSACQPIRAPGPTATAAPSPTVTPAPAPSPTAEAVVKLNHDQIISKALAGNLLGDPATRKFNVILPPSYASSTDRRYPVVYMLHGYTGDENYAWEVMSDVKSLLGDGTIQEMILVFPDANNTLGGSMYLSSPTIGDYETYLTSELVDYVDANYRTIPAKEGRGIAGCSMGGDGAIHLAFKYPDLYDAAVGISGTYDWTKDPWLEEGAIWFKEVPQTLREFGFLPYSTEGQIAMAAAIASNAEKPPFFLDMPYEIVDGKAQIAPAFLERLAQTSPMHDADMYLQQPTRVGAVMLYNGKYDSIVGPAAGRAFDAYLTKLGIDHDYVEVDSGHCPSDNKPVLRFISDNLPSEER